MVQMPGATGETGQYGVWLCSGSSWWQQLCTPGCPEAHKGSCSLAKKRLYWDTCRDKLQDH